MAKDATPKTGQSDFKVELAKIGLKAGADTLSRIATLKVAERLFKSWGMTDLEKDEARAKRILTKMERIISKAERKDIRDEKRIERMVKRSFLRDRFMVQYHRFFRMVDRKLAAVAGRMNLRRMETRWTNRHDHHNARYERITTELEDVRKETLRGVRLLPAVKKELEQATEDDRPKADGAIIPKVA